MSFSSQGASTHCKIKIFDYKHKLVTWRWLWTAITRAKQVHDVYVYILNNNKHASFNNNSLRAYVDQQKWVQHARSIGQS
jgi:transposase-like protein